jgi:hypothetical protein
MSTPQERPHEPPSVIAFDVNETLLDLRALDDVFARPGMPLSPIGPRPDIVGADLDAIADRIVQATP